LKQARVFSRFSSDKLDFQVDIWHALENVAKNFAGDFKETCA